MAERKTLISTGEVARNRKARFNYTIEETLEAGLVLFGSEVKSLRHGRANIAEAYVAVEGDALVLVNAHIAEYAQSGYVRHKETRSRALLLKKKEIQRLSGAVKRKGYTIVPLKLYFNVRGIAKVEIGLAVGKETHDKRETQQTRDWDRQKARLLRGKQSSRRE